MRFETPGRSSGLLVRPNLEQMLKRDGRLNGVNAQIVRIRMGDRYTQWPDLLVETTWAGNPDVLS
jgi:hypothetical protein